MKCKSLFLGISLFFLSSCSNDDSTDEENQTAFKQRMRDFVIEISAYSKSINSNFCIVPQNGIELVTDNGEGSGNPNIAYLNAIDANGQEDLFYGYDFDNQETPVDVINYLNEFLTISRNTGNVILVTDYCSTPSKMSNSYIENANRNYVSYAANERELSLIPTFPATLQNESNSIITNISQVKNFLYLINPSNYNSKSDFITAVTATNYDLVIMDLFFKDGVAFTTSEINQLKNKANGGKRMLLSYMSIGEAENYRYYWQSNWNTSKPSWMDAENPNWEGNYKVKYWDSEWKNIIFGNENSYLKKIINSNFDGVYLDIIDAFEYYEN